MSKYLVAISTKTWRVPRVTIAYYEVEATDEYYARHRAWNWFENDLKCVPKISKLLEINKVNLNELCAGDSVEL
jgi:hypothetical protein